ncbi:rapunzel 6 [Sphaeramia orbicularis]|uniref:Protein rapunzel-like n=1 Tax=Sphaeramia orbicularis TaxID=375764 RepID=A0A673AAT1_9TELE|nr:protein rapunzel-like [Sphaeramia orbicularis]XP_030013654.1 protein rapunzel-like [Sphaeramia orbicularis]
MTSSLEKVVAQKKEAIEAVMDMFEKGAEVMASTVGELFPLCEAAAPVLRLTLDNVLSKEVFYVKEQFLTLRDKLDMLSLQLEDIDNEIKKGRLDSHYFSVEENIRNQFRKYMDILEAKQQFREVKTRLFLEHFSKTGGEKNLHVLYDALMGESSFGESVLELVERYVSRNRRLLEDFCVRMKELFCLGLIALLGHCALTQAPEEEQDKIQAWSSKIEEVESKMKMTVESCIAAFPDQAKSDSQRFLQEKDEQNLQETTQQLLEFLMKKYDWVSWSVRLIHHSGSTYRNWRAGEHFHQVAGQNWFEVPQVNNMDLVVSYSTKPTPVPRHCIQQVMEVQGRKGNAPAVVEALEKQLDGFVVHAVSRHKESAAAWSFPEDCHYWDRHKNVALCVHSE